MAVFDQFQLFWGMIVEVEYNQNQVDNRNQSAEEPGGSIAVHGEPQYVKMEESQQIGNR